MEIKITRMPQEGRRITGSEALEFPELEGNRLLSIAGPVSYDLTGKLGMNVLTVKGTVSVDISFTCSRCAEAGRMAVAGIPIEAFFDIEPEVEFVDLTPEVRESILLTLPAYPVCKRECKGVCAGCGVNLNTGNCVCKRDEPSIWGALDRLDVKR